MEPLFFKAENELVFRTGSCGSSRFNGAAFFQSGKFDNIEHFRPPTARLQWSRFFSKRKMSFRRKGLATKTSCFNGAAFFQSGKSVCCQVRLPSCQRASMEPLFFKAENRVWRVGRCPSNVMLQWSRFFSKRKIRGVRSVVATWRRFNGAAFFQSGKSRIRCVVYE